MQKQYHKIRISATISKEAAKKLKKLSKANGVDISKSLNYLIIQML